MISPRWLLAVSLMRWLFVPVFMVMAMGLLPYDGTTMAVTLVLLFIFGLTNGYCGTLAFMQAPEMCFVDERSTAGTIMTFTLFLSLFTGAMVGC